MMKTACAVVGVAFFGLVMVGMGRAQPPQVEWARSCGWGYSSAHDVQQTSDGGYVFTGGIWPDPYEDPDIQVIKTDSLGHIVWHREFGYCYSYEVGNSVQQTIDGGYIIAAAGDTSLIKTDDHGYMLWARSYDGMNAADVKQSSDGGYILAGTINLADSYDLYLIKTDSLGDTLWTRTYGGAEREFANCVRQTTDGGYIILGRTGRSDPFYDIFLVKTDESGDTMWTHTYGGPENEWIYSIQQTIDGGYVMVGASSSFGAYSCSIYLIRTNDVGDTLWTCCYGGEDVRSAQSIVEEPDGGYFLGGTISLGTLYVSFFVRTDEWGDTLWTQIYYEEYFTFLPYYNDAENTSDMGYIEVANTCADEYNCFPWLIKIAPDTFIYKSEIQVSDSLLDFGQVSIGADSSHSVMIHNTGNGYLHIHSVVHNDPVFSTDFSPNDSLIAPGDSLLIGITFSPQDTVAYQDTLRILNNNELVEVVLRGIGAPSNATEWAPEGHNPTSYGLASPFPNPFNAQVTIRFDVPVIGEMQMAVYNVLGRKVAMLVNGIMEAGSHRITWDATEIPSGIYFVRMEAGEFVQTRKVVLLK
jgi:hypothetical protein